MPSTFTHSPAETERKEPGIGGKPPLDRRPTGGGGGGGDDDGKNEGRGPRELLHRVRFFVYSALAADMLFFAVLVLFFFARQTGLRMDPRTHLLVRDWHPLLLPPILYLNTAVLLLSSLTMERARRNIFREVDVLEEWLGLGHPALRRTLPWLAATLTLGVLFLGRAVFGLEATDCTRLCLRSLVDAGELFFLRYYRPACGSPGRRHSRPGSLLEHSRQAQASRVSAGRRRFNRMVLARNEPCLAAIDSGAGRRAIAYAARRRRMERQRSLKLGTSGHS